MKKFKVYRTSCIIAILLYGIILFLPFTASPSVMLLRQIISAISLIAFLILCAFLISLLNYFKEPVWKKIAVIGYLIGHIIAYYVYLFKYKADAVYFSILILVYLPFIIAFIAIHNKEIRPLAQSFGYTIFLVLMVRIGLIISKGKFNLLPYSTAINFIIIIPSVIKW